jgi:hypothetical protein
VARVEIDSAVILVCLVRQDHRTVVIGADVVLHERSARIRRDECVYPPPTGGGSMTGSERRIMVGQRRDFSAIGPCYSRALAIIGIHGSTSDAVTPSRRRRPALRRASA